MSKTLVPLALLGLAGLTLTGLFSEDESVRRVFFSFHYQRDIWRVNQIRNHWVAKEHREAAGYFDGSLWEKSQTAGSAKVKKLIDDGLSGASVTCVLIGAETYTRHWVNYEIFRSIELGKGVFGVRINGLKDQNGKVDPSTPTPFECLGFGTHADYPRKMVPYVHYQDGWKVYRDADAINPSSAPYLKIDDKPMLASLFKVYDWVSDKGYENFNRWAQDAAKQAGR